MSNEQSELSLGELPPELAEVLRGQLSTTEKVRAFALAGSSHFTIRSTQTGVRFTYRVRAPHPHYNTEWERRAWEKRPIWFVAVLTGPDNCHHYEYIGQIRSSLDGVAFDYGSKSRIGPQALSVSAFRWFWNAVVLPKNEVLFRHVEVWHEGRCGRCGRMLTVPESIESGFGPDCAALMKGGA